MPCLTAPSLRVELASIITTRHAMDSNPCREVLSGSVSLWGRALWKLPRGCLVCWYVSGIHILLKRAPHVVTWADTVSYSINFLFWRPVRNWFFSGSEICHKIERFVSGCEAELLPIYHLEIHPKVGLPVMCHWRTPKGRGVCDDVPQESTTMHDAPATKVGDATLLVASAGVFSVVPGPSGWRWSASVRGMQWHMVTAKQLQAKCLVVSCRASHLRCTGSPDNCWCWSGEQHSDWREERGSYRAGKQNVTELCKGNKIWIDIVSGKKDVRNQLLRCATHSSCLFSGRSKLSQFQWLFLARQT